MQTGNKGTLFDPVLHPLAQARTKSFDVLLDRTEAFIPPRTQSPLPSSSAHLSSFVASQNEIVLEYMRTLGEDCTESQDEEVLGDHVHSQAYAQEQRDDESDTGDSISSLDSVDSFLQTHDYVIDLRRKLHQTSLQSSTKTLRPQMNSTRTRAHSAPARPSSTLTPPSPTATHSRPQSRASTQYDAISSRPTLHVGSELSRKIEELRSDPIKRAELEERIQGYKDSKIRATQQQRNVLEDNKDMSRHLPEVRAVTFQEQVVNHSRQIENVLDTKKEITEEVMQRRLAIIHRKEIEAAQEEKKVRVFVHKSKLELIQRRWMVMIAFGARQGKWMASLQQARLERLNFAHRDAAARKIQKAYRRYIAIVHTQRLRHQLAVVHKALRRFIFRFRVRRRHRAADTIRRFVDDIMDTTRVAKVIKKFRFGVTHAQRYMREMLETEKVQIGILMKQWNRAEHELETAFYHGLEKERTRQVIMSKSLYYEGPSARPKNKPVISSKPFSMQASPSLDAQYQQGFPKVPTRVKFAVLLAALREKKIAYGKALAEYARIQVLFDEAEKRRSDLERARQILTELPASAPTPTPVTEPPKKQQTLKSAKSLPKPSKNAKHHKRSTTPSINTTTSQRTTATPSIPHVPQKLTTSPQVLPLKPISSASPSSLTSPSVPPKPIPSSSPAPSSPSLPSLSLPPKPIFVLLLTHEEAIALVNKGVSIVQEQQKQKLLQHLPRLQSQK